MLRTLNLSDIPLFFLVKFIIQYKIDISYSCHHFYVAVFLQYSVLHLSNQPNSLKAAASTKIFYFKQTLCLKSFTQHFCPYGKFQLHFGLVSSNDYMTVDRSQLDLSQNFHNKCISTALQSSLQLSAVVEQVNSHSNCDSILLELMQILQGFFFQIYKSYASRILHCILINDTAHYFPYDKCGNCIIFP